MRHLPEVDPQACKHPHHVLDTDLIAPDDHVLVLALTHALSAAGQHGEVLVPHGGVDLFVDGLVTGALLVAGGREAGHPAVADGAPSGRAGREDVDELRHVPRFCVSSDHSLHHRSMPAKLLASLIPVGARRPERSGKELPTSRHLRSAS